MDTDNDKLGHVANCIQLWWMTQKHEPMHRDVAEDLARTAIDAVQSQSEASQLSGVVGERDDLLVQCSLHAENSTRLIEALEWASAYDPQLVEQIMARAALNNTGGQSDGSLALLAERLLSRGHITDAEHGMMLGGITKQEGPSV